MPRKNPRKHFTIFTSLGMIFTLLLATANFALVNIASFGEASAQEDEGSADQQSGGSVQVSFEYTYFEEFDGTTRSAKYTGSAVLRPVEGGFDGNGTGTYEGLDINPPYDPCTEPQRTTYAGTADLIVHAQYSIDNSITGGPDTSQYSSNTTVIELIFNGDNISAESTNVGGGENCESQSWTTSVGSDCHFYGIDFTKGGTYQKTDEDSSAAKCKIQISAAVRTFKIFGTVNGIIDGKSSVPISNSKVVMKFDEGYLKKLSSSKPQFTKATATTDDDKAKYEFKLEGDSGKLPKVLVVSLLWYDGKPEFAVTNGAALGGRDIPVYQAACVDDVRESKCYKWEQKSDGSYEAEVNFEYGNDDQIDRQATFMESEDWEGQTTTRKIMMDSAYIYYNSYRAIKYFDSLALGYPQNAVKIQSHYMSGSCTTNPDNAWYSHATYPFGDLGEYLPKVDGKGGAVFLCSKESASDVVEAPVNREWHELGHYLLYQMYSPLKSCSNCKDHGGFANDNTSWSFIEGFAEFAGALINKHYGNPTPYLYPIGPSTVNLETDYKSWGSGSLSVDEELAVAGTLWDLYDPGKEIAIKHVMNGTFSDISKVYPNPVDEVSLDEKLILQVIQKGKPQTVVALYSGYEGTYVSKVNLDMIFLDHGFFADVVERNFVQDSMDEKIPESGHTPTRLNREHLPASLPGSFLVSDNDGLFNVTIAFEQSDQYDYSYLLEMKTGEPAYFTMPPKYYPSKATITPVSAQGKELTGALEIKSDDYWDYTNSNPPADGVFKHVSTQNDSRYVTNTIQYIENVKDLLSRVSEEYKGGNYTGAEELATIAYIDNFENVEQELVAHNSTDLKEQTEQMLRVELIGLIKAKADSDQVDAKIAEINAKLDEAIIVVPEFPAGITAAMLAILVASIIFFTRYKRESGFHFW